MSTSLPRTRLFLATLLALAVLPLTSAPSAGAAEPEAIDFFDAVKEGKIDAKLILKDSKKGNLLVQNKGKQPLKIRMPDGFAGKPVLAQFQPGLGGGGLGGGLGGNQGVGGNLGGGGLGGGLFNVAPEQLKKLPVNAVCLEHGKKEPNPRVKYDVIPVSKYTDDGRVHELIRYLASDNFNQRVAQVAAWHLASGMSFDQLAAKTNKRANGNVEPYFSRAEIMAGVELVAIATKRAEQRAKTEGSVSSAAKE